MPRVTLRPLVALDIETTGLDADSDAIIEIGAVRFKGDRVEDEWSTLVNPSRPLSPFITSLTGINDSMVAGAPRIAQVLPTLTEFVGECDIVGHNVKFDLGFIRKKGALRHNDGIDTFDLASVLVPTAGRYSLASLGAALGIPLPATHRALDDARVTYRLYRALVQKGRELPLNLLAEITNLGQEVENWGAGVAFEEALRARLKEKVGRAAHGTPSLFGEPPPLSKPVKPNPEIKPLDVTALARILEEDGAFAHAFPHFEHRPQQVEMLRRVARAFSEKKHLMVEAGTGTGKSLAYLIPAIQWAVQNGERVVVSTNTINLQDQLINKDVPDLREALEVDFHAAVLKGRSNYICPRRFEALRKHGPKNADEMRLLAKLLVWLSTGSNEQRGDRASLTLSGPGETGAWSRLSAEDEGCTTDRCAEQMSGICPFYRARRAAEAAHVLIVNHALLLADVALENRVLPEYKLLVVDEAHHLEAATTDGLSFVLKRKDMEDLLDLGGPRSGVLGSLSTAIRGALPPDQLAMMQNEIERAYSSTTTAVELSRTFFEAVAAFMEEQRDGGPVGDYTQQARILPNTRSQSSWADVEETWAQFRDVLAPLVGRLGGLVKGLAELAEHEIPDVEAHASDLASAARRLDEAQTQLNGLVSKPDPQMIYWVELSNDGSRLSLHAAPLAVGPLIEKFVWNKMDSVVLTSATLTTAGKFNYIRSRLNANSVEEASVGSPFDYASSTLLYLVNDIPEPNERQANQKAVESGLIPLCRATKGRALVLFTSHAQLRQTAQAIRGPLEREGIVVYDQSDGMSRHQLLENFRGNEQAVLLGTKSFWEGIDVPGEALSVLVIVKLPFDVPSDPIIAARSETFENAFYDYNVPEAVLRFRQGFGRLIRTQTDRGVVAVFDRRLLTKQYGRQFLASLPPCARREGPMSGLPGMAAKWIDG
ncbi:MAG: DEAD/DEAH box helicase [Chloroflexi bacterium]|nr:DEAD/DEAH box helicase [Chloroflexota bacterium]